MAFPIRCESFNKWFPRVFRGSPRVFDTWHPPSLSERAGVLGGVKTPPKHFLKHAKSLAFTISFRAKKTRVRLFCGGKFRERGFWKSPPVGGFPAIKLPAAQDKQSASFDVLEDSQSA